MSEVSAQETMRGCSLAVLRDGSGPALLYLHGLSRLSADSAFAQMLCEDFSLIAPDHPGFGASSQPEWLDSIHDLAYFYLYFLREMDLRDVHLVASSLGGWIALEMAVRDTSRLASLTLIAPAGVRVDGQVPGDIFMWSLEELARNSVEDAQLGEAIWQADQAAAEERFRNLQAAARVGWHPRFFNPDLPKWLDTIQIPTQIIWGERDRIFPVEYGRRLAELLPNSRLTVMPNCGHLPQIEKTADVARQIRDFAQGVAK